MKVVWLVRQLASREMRPSTICMDHL